jgi:hypothetical protein
MDLDVLTAMPEFQQEYLNAHASLGLQQRVTMMNQLRAESPPWTVFYLRSAYRRLGIKYKMVGINRCGRRPD